MINFLIILIGWFGVVKILSTLARHKWSFWVGYHLVCFLAAMQLLQRILK
jgi:hypothetical protein